MRIVWATSVVFAALAGPGSVTAQQRQAPQIDVRVDPRVELLSAVFRLAGNPEYSRARVESYAAAVDERFAPLKDHAVVAHARRLRAGRGVSFDAVASLAIHLDPAMVSDVRSPQAEARFEPWPARLDARWGDARDLRLFLGELADFAQESDAAEFFASQRSLYDHSVRQVQALLDEHADLAWFDEFFGARARSRFRLAIGLLNGGNSYGPSVELPDGSEELYCVLGCWTTDDEGMPLFPRTVLQTIAHEFCHSYCNPIVDAHLDELQPAGEALFELVADAMRRQAYTTARILLCESLVRACVVRYVAQQLGDAAARREVEMQRRNSFVWTGELAELLTEYERDRKRYATLDAFVPRLVTFFADYVPRLREDVGSRPRVSSITPQNGADDVDPETTAIVITFDRPMQDRMWSVVGGGETFPEVTGAPSYDQARKVLTIPVALRPAWTYRFGLNSAQHNAFRSADGKILQPVDVTFTTRPR